MVVGWQFATHMRTTLVLDALWMALGLRAPGADVELVHHSDRGSQDTPAATTRRRSHDHEVARSLGSTGDRYDKGLVSQCTSWGRLDVFSFVESPAEAFDESGVAGVGRVVEPFVLVVGLA